MKDDRIDYVMVGAGIMSATLAVLIKELEPEARIEIFESLDAVAEESSAPWNNAGTGHAALCELNYTPQRADGSVNCQKAFEINEAFEISRQFWSYLVEKGAIPTPRGFIQPVPHLSFVRGSKDAEYLQKRHQGLSQHHAFADMEYSEDYETLREWFPLMMDGRSPNEKVAATRFSGGTDVNFGALSRLMIKYLQKQEGFTLHLGQRVSDLKRKKNGSWRVTVRAKDGRRRSASANFVFLGAGGGALPLLQKADVPEGRGFGGFPVSGQFLRCINPAVIERHFAKVYGKAAVGAPPMSVPHLDTRVIDGKKELLFGPFAGFSTRFLKHGSLLDLPLSIKPDNLTSMLSAGKDNMNLTAYLIAQVMQSPADRMAALQEFVPDAKLEDWTLVTAGQRVQIIKKDAAGNGALQFGTEVVSAEDGSIAALLGASPGASTSVAIMLSLLRQCFPEKMRAAGSIVKLRQMIPSDGESLVEDGDLYRRIRAWADETLHLGESIPA